MSGTRWSVERSTADSHDYVQRFVDLADEGADLHGEARFVDAVAAPGSTVLDAGCGTGRVGAELARRGHTVTAVDLDPVLVAAARTQPGITVHQADLAELELGQVFDVVVCAGNVLVFLAPGSERGVLGRLAGHLSADGRLVVGFATDRDYTVAGFDDDCAAVGLVLEQRFATWDLRPWIWTADWAVSVLRHRA